VGIHTLLEGLRTDSCVVGEFKSRSQKFGQDG
jgi:hypothetical protein